MSSERTSQSPYGFVAANRSLRPLADICVPGEGIQTGPFGSQLHSADYVEVGTPIISVEHLGENLIEGKNPPLVSAEDVQRLSKYTLKAGDIVFSRVGSVDRRAIVSADQDGWMFSGRLLRVRPEPDLVDPTYLSYFFGLPMFKNYIRSIAVGATMPSLNTALLSDVPVILPDMAEQVAIGTLFSSLDAKIKINRAVADSLTGITQSIFKSWFMDFDPVKARISGEKPVGMDDQTASIFPNSMEDSELGPIPKGWRVLPADKLFDVGIGRTPPRKESEWFSNSESEVPWVSIRDMGTFGTFSRSTNEHLTRDAVSKFRVPIVPEHTVLMSFKLTVGKLCITDRPLVTNEAIAHFRVPEDGPLDSNYAFLWLSAYDMETLDSTSSIGTATNSGVIRNIKFIVPPKEVVLRFKETIDPIFQSLKVLERESTTLKELRDSLLPRLISGEQQIPEKMLVS